MLPRKIRVLYVCLERLNPGSAAATHVGEICEGLRRRGFEVVLKARHGAARGGLAEQAGRYLGVLSGALGALPRADIVYVRSHFVAVPLAFAARGLGRPIIHEINGSYDDAFVTHPRFARLRRGLVFLQRKQYQWATTLIAVTPKLVAWGAREAGHDRAVLVGNGANTALFRAAGPTAERARPYVLFFGGLTRWHGVEVMMQAARSRAWPEPVELVVAGPLIDRSLKPLLEAPPPNVTWLGPVSQAELPALIRGAVAGLVPAVDPKGVTSFGITPLKLFELLACGTPVIVSEFEGMADLVRRGGCGLVVPSGDPDALAAAVAELARDHDRARAMGKAGARLVSAEHSWDARAGETARVIAKALR